VKGKGSFVESKSLGYIKELEEEWKKKRKLFYVFR
jgi:hypothetical protein